MGLLSGLQSLEIAVISIRPNHHHAPRLRRARAPTVDTARILNAVLSQIPADVFARCLRSAGSAVDDAELADTLFDLAKEPELACDALMRSSATYLSYTDLGVC